jgi:hypothetical protein
MLENKMFFCVIVGKPQFSPTTVAHPNNKKTRRLRRVLVLLAANVST